MFTKIRNRRVAASILLLTLVIMLAVGYFFRRQSLDNSMAKVMYLIPEDETKIEDLVKPETLANQTDIWIETTSDWRQVSRLATDGKVYAVIIHHAAVNQVDLEELQYLIQHKRLVVAAIGIPTDQLSEMMGELSSLQESFANGCKGYLCSVIYSTREADGIIEVMPPDDVRDQLDLGMATRTEGRLLISDDDIYWMLRSITSHVWEMQRDYQSSGEARPTLTPSEIEDLLKDPNHQ